MQLGRDTLTTHPSTRQKYSGPSLTTATLEDFSRPAARQSGTGRLSVFDGGGTSGRRRRCPEGRLTGDC